MCFLLKVFDATECGSETFSGHKKKQTETKSAVEWGFQCQSMSAVRLCLTKKVSRSGPCKAALMSVWMQRVYFVNLLPTNIWSLSEQASTAESLISKILNFSSQKDVIFDEMPPRTHCYSFHLHNNPFSSALSNLPVGSTADGSRFYNSTKADRLIVLFVFLRLNITLLSPYLPRRFSTKERPVTYLNWRQCATQPASGAHTRQQTGNEETGT